MKQSIAAWLLCITTNFLFAQDKAGKIINATEVMRIESVLASDQMRGRKVYTEEIDRAADFISAEFKAAGLQPLGNSGGFRQEFAMVTAKHLSSSATMNGRDLDPKDVVVITSLPAVQVTDASGFDRVRIAKGENLFMEALEYISSGKNHVVLVDTSFARSFPRLSGFRRGLYKSESTVVFVLSSDTPQSFRVESRHEIKEQKLANVVGVLSGKSRKNEYVIFSAHYDHIGTGKPVNGDSIYNGANDDAAGTTAVILLAKYFSALRNNERTIVFAAFTAEESGGFGSRYFSRQLDAGNVVAMFNIEMIGTESKWGKNSAYITGYDKTDMGKILERNLANTGFTFYPDPYPEQELFYRSDNATLARLGVPAHTISTAKMDQEPHYHKVTDHVETLDMDNMAMIIRAIALSSKTIISGKDAPSRVRKEDLR